MLQVPAATGEIRSLLMSRNEMAGYAARKRVRQERDKVERSQLSPRQLGARPSSPGKVDLPQEDDEFAHLDDLPDLTTSGGLCATGVSLTTDVEELSILPPTIDNERECSRCYASDACMLYRRVSTYSPFPISMLTRLSRRTTSSRMTTTLSPISLPERLAT